MKYNKLVRDFIPNIIEESGKECSYELLDDNWYVVELLKKFYEEIGEYVTADNEEHKIEELADILEILHALIKIHCNFEDVEKVRKEKKEKRGGFDKRVYLKEVN